MNSKESFGFHNAPAEDADLSFIQYGRCNLEEDGLQGSASSLQLQDIIPLAATDNTFSFDQPVSVPTTTLPATLQAPPSPPRSHAPFHFCDDEQCRHQDSGIESLYARKRSSSETFCRFSDISRVQQTKRARSVEDSTGEDKGKSHQEMNEDTTVFTQLKRRAEHDEMIQWHSMYNQLRQFHRTNGHCIVPKHKLPLGPWVKNQRYLYKLYVIKCGESNFTSMNAQRIQLLNTLDFKWDESDALWEEKFLELKEFVRNFGHCNVGLYHHNTTMFGELNKWMKHQSQQKKLFDKNEKAAITVQRIEKLNSVGFNWK